MGPHANRSSRSAARRPATALNDADETVRQVALHSISVRRDAGASPRLIKIVETGTPQNQRAAAEALGRIGDRSAVPALLEASGRLESKPAEHDRILEHSLASCVIEIDDPAATKMGLDSDRPWKRRAALIALDQMEGGTLEPTKVAVLLSGADRVLREAASWILGHHAEWGSAC